MNPNDIQSEGVRAIDQDEHSGEGHAKRVIIRAQDPNTGDWVNIGAGDSGDGFGLTFTKADYAVRVDDSDDDVTYVGKAAIGSTNSSSVWQIKKIDSTSGADITWADGNNSFDNIWDDRLGLSYA